MLGVLLALGSGKKCSRAQRVPTTVFSIIFVGGVADDAHQTAARGNPSNGGRDSHQQNSHFFFLGGGGLGKSRLQFRGFKALPRSRER